MALFAAGEWTTQQASGSIISVKLQRDQTDRNIGGFLRDDVMLRLKYLISYQVFVYLHGTRAREGSHR